MSDAPDVYGRARYAEQISAQLATIQALTARCDALAEALRAHAPPCGREGCHARATRCSAELPNMRGCDACAAEVTSVAWADVEHAAAIRLLGGDRG